MTAPDTERDPVTEPLHDEEIVDPYRWLEATDDAVTEWERRQNEYTDQFLETDRREALRPAFEAVAERTTYNPLTIREGRYFQQIEPPEADQPRLTVRETVDGEPEVLVDPEQQGETVSLQWYVPDRVGERVLCGFMERGTEQYDLVVIDVEDGAELDRIDGVGRCNPLSVAWTDGGFYYQNTGSADEGEQLNKELRFYDLDGGDRLVTDEISAERWPRIEVDAESGTTIVAMGELGTDTDLYALENGALVPVLDGVDAEFQPLVANGRVYLHTNHDAPRFRVLSIPAEEFAEAESVDEFSVAIPESDAVIAGVESAGNGIAVHRDALARDDWTHSTVSIHDADGRERYELDLPDFVGIDRGSMDGNEATDELAFLLLGFDRPAQVVHVDVSADAGPDDWAVVQSPTLPDELDPRGALELTIDRIRVDSTDGATVPAYVVHRADLEPDGDAPTVLWGYGGFRISPSPRVDPYRLPFLRDGGVFVLAGLRGGLEFGEKWHEDGSGKNKPHTFEDFEAVAEALIDRGYTNSDRLAGWGGSNGGLTVGAALTRRPDLFGAIVCRVPLLDMLRFHRFLLGQAWTGEYGSPEDPEAFEWLRSYSPYHNVEETEYPATLFATAAGDTRVHPAHARKMTARVQDTTTGDDPICFRSYEDAGHGTGIPTSLEIEQNLDRWTWVYEQFDIDLTT